MAPVLAVAARHLTGFGEVVALLPAGAVLGAGLALRGRRRTALAWIAGLGAAVAATAILKACCPGFTLDLFAHSWQARSAVSGHAAMSVAFYGGLAVLLWRAAPRHKMASRGAAVVLVCLAAAVCWSVWVLHWHNALDVACGVLVGALCPAGLMIAAKAPAAAGAGL